MLDRLEESYARPAFQPPLPRPSWRARVLSHVLWLPRTGPVLIVVGLVTMAAALPSSTAASGVGALVATIGGVLTGRRIARWSQSRIRRRRAQRRTIV